MIDQIRQVLGIEFYRISHTERLVSVLGAFLGILIVLLVSHWFVEGQAVYLVVASMGASAVLLFAVPHGALSQPWALVGGHFVSAIVGVTCARYIQDPYIAASLGVALAVGAMHYLHCIHPPGGATALTAVVGGSSVTDLGYLYIAEPVLLNVVAILFVAVVFNFFFHWRRYPVFFARRISTEDAEPADEELDHVAREDFVYALSQMDSVMDVTENDLVLLYDLVTKRRDASLLDPDSLKLGHCYSNGKYGDDWSVRQIVDWESEGEAGERKIIYKTLAGPGRRSSGVEPAREFVRWARYEVYLDEENWRRVGE